MATDDEDFAAMFAESERDKPKAKRPKVGDVIKVNTNTGEYLTRV